MFAATEDFPALSPLRQHWTRVRDELRVLDGPGFIDWPETDIYTGAWTVFPFYRFGERIERTCALCPATVALLEAIPGMVTAGFSRLAPGTHIQPHCGYTDAVWRGHLGLTNTEACGLRVGDETREWWPGSLFVFDDTTEHEAWNRGTGTRTVLLFDFKRDPAADIMFPDHVRRYGGDLEAG